MHVISELANVMVDMSRTDSEFEHRRLLADYDFLSEKATPQEYTRALALANLRLRRIGRIF